MDHRHHLLRNRYEIIEDLGGGGFGKVFKAIDSQYNLPIAVKTIQAKYSRNPEIIRLFEQEARITSGFNDPHIVQIHDYFNEGNLYFIVMEFVDGKDLQKLLQQQGYGLLQDEETNQVADYQETVLNLNRILLKFSTISEIILQICDGLQIAHENNPRIVHCDLKPENLLVNSDGMIKIADFGISRIKEGLIRDAIDFPAGTKQYSSPEQRSGGNVDHRSDIYSLGVIFFYLVTGRFPHSDDSKFFPSFHDIQQIPSTIKDLRIDTPETVISIIKRCLEPYPEDRYQSVSELAYDLRSAIPPKDDDLFLSKSPDKNDEIQQTKIALCPKCLTPFTCPEEAHYTCLSCSHSFSVEKGAEKKQDVEKIIFQTLLDMGIQNSENFQTSVRSYQFKTKIEPWILLEETKAETDVEFLLRDGSFSFPSSLNLPPLSVTNDEILEAIKNLNFIFLFWNSAVITPYIVALQSETRKNQSLYKINGLIGFLFGMYHTIRASRLSENAQSQEYISALNHFRFAKQSLDEIFNQLTPFQSAIYHSTGFSIDLCQIAENSYKSPDNNRAGFVKYEEKLRKGCEWDQRIADNCLRLAGKEPLRTPTFFPWQRNQEQSIQFNEFPTLELIRIPAGEFLMGADKSYHSTALQNDWSSKPDGDRIVLEDFLISKFPITVGQFAFFVKESNYQTTAEKCNNGRVYSENHWKCLAGACWKHPQGPESSIRQKLRHPVVQISFFDALEYCKWLSRKVNKKVTLPSEAHWEKAARGANGRVFPWGSESPNKDRCNYLNLWKDTKPVGYYSKSPLEVRQTFPWGTPKYINQDSPYGCCDLAGNVWEWTRTLFKPYPYRPLDGRENLESSGPRVIRGGAFDSTASELRTFTRRKMYPDQAYGNLGFRIVVFDK